MGYNATNQIKIRWSFSSIYGASSGKTDTATASRTPKNLGETSLNELASKHPMRERLSHRSITRKQAKPPGTHKLGSNFEAPIVGYHVSFWHPWIRLHFWGVNCGLPCVTLAPKLGSTLFFGTYELGSTLRINRTSVHNFLSLQSSLSSIVELCPFQSLEFWPFVVLQLLSRKSRERSVGKLGFHN